jgi:hypothetical protein
MMLVAMVVMMAVIETVLMMVMMMAIVVGTLSKFPFRKDLATLRVALSIPAPPTTHEHPFP